MEIWAKSNGETLKEHTEKVKENIKSLIEKINSFYFPSEGFLNEILIKEKVKEEFFKLLELVAIYHDLGKVSPSFQRNTVYNPDFENFEEFPDVPHSFLSPAFFNKEKIKEFENLARFLGCNYRELLKIVFSTIAFHHWRENYVEKFLNKWELVEKSIEKLKDWQECMNELKNIDSEIINYINGINPHYSKLLIPPDNLVFLIRELEQDLSKTQKNFFILLKGFLHRADHFASSYLGNEIEISPLGSQEVENRIKEEIRRRAQERYKLQIKDEEIWQLEKVKDTKDKNVFLKATTGVGKTEFALLWAKGKKLIYVLPLRTAVNAMWKRLRNIFGDDEVGLLHSDALFYLEDIKDHSRDENISESFISYDLAKNLSYPVIVATADQFFTAGLKYPGYEKIYSTFAYSYVVLDEIQLYDPRIAAIIIKTLEEITKLGAKFCIMSATLPEFYQNIMKDRKINFEELEYIPQNLKKHKIQLIESGILIESKDEKGLNEEIKNYIKKFVEKGKKVLIILNTIRAAKEVYEKIKEEFKDKNICLIHSQFTLKDRKEKEEIFESERDYPDVLIATQVAEVSLDIDYDVLFTELAPLDSIFQRMGRVLRRYRKDYEYNEDSPNVFICGNVKNNEIKNVSGVGTIYREDVLISTSELLKDKDGKMDEKGKIELINKFYNKLEKDKGYFSEFEKMLDILDSLFSVESRKRAQEVFRDIIQISGISETRKEEFLSKIKPLVSEMSKVIDDYEKFRKEWYCKWKGTNDSDKKELEKKLKSKTQEYLCKRREINLKVFEIIADSVVHIYPTKQILDKKIPLTIVINEEIVEKEINTNLRSRIRKWLSNIFEEIYILEKVEYDEEKGAIILDEKHGSESKGKIL